MHVRATERWLSIRLCDLNCWTETWPARQSTHVHTNTLTCSDYRKRWPYNERKDGPISLGMERQTMVGYRELQSQGCTTNLRLPGRHGDVARFDPGRWRYSSVICYFNRAAGFITLPSLGQSPSRLRFESRSFVRSTRLSISQDLGDRLHT